MNFSKRVCFLFTIVLLPWCSTTWAGLVVYTDPTPFQTAGVGVLEDFEGVPVTKDAGVLSFTNHGITYTGTQASNPNVYVASPGYNNFGIAPASTTSSVLTGNGNEEFKMEFGAGYKAIGFDVYLNNGKVSDNPYTPVTTNWYSGSTLINTYTDTRPAGLYFLGLSSDVAITKITWVAAAGDQINTGIDNLRVAADTVPVPVPGAVLLGFVGLSVAGGWLRRKVG